MENRIYRGLRERILIAYETQGPFFGVVEAGESVFGARMPATSLTRAVSVSHFASAAMPR